MEVKIKQGSEMLDATIEMVDVVMVVSPKEVKWKPNYGDLYYKPGIRGAEINVISDGWSDSDLDESYYDKGWTFKTYEECDAFCDKLRHAIEGVKP